MNGDAGRIITLLTDFSLSDPFVGIMKGVILGINPDAVLVDLCHTGRAYDPVEGAFLLATSYRYFPQDTVHIAVIDPGVGGPRRPILVACDGHLFVGPDNGLLAPLAERAGSSGIRVITAAGYFLHPVSATFHGRDIFAPVAAHLSLGLGPDEFGDVIADYIRLVLPRPVMSGDSLITGEILHIDRFGNLVTNITESDLERMAAGDRLTTLQVRIVSREIPMVRYYAEVSPGSPGAVIGSAKYLEIFVNRGDASKLLGVTRGAPVTIERREVSN